MIAHGAAGRTALQGKLDQPETGKFARFGRAAGILIGMSALLSGQTLGHFNPLSQSANGIHLYGASVSTMYSGGTGAGMGLGIPYPTASAPGTRLTTLQASAALGWSRMAEKSSFSVTYSPSYVRGLSGASFDSTNHAASLSLSRPLGRKWTLGASANALLSDFNQLPFARGRYGNIAMIPATFDELASAIITGSSGNTALNQAVNAVPLISSPETAFLYGGRIFSLSAGISTDYAYSSRSSLNMSFNATRAQSFEHGSNLNRAGSNTFLPKTTSASASLSWSYSLSPRTTLGATLYTSRTFSRWQDGYGNQAGLSIGRTLSNRWFVQAMAGVGWITTIRQTFQPARGPQLTFGASTGYKLYAHTFVASFNRSVSDMYGLGANASENSSGGWSWRIPGSTVSMSAGFGYARLIGPAFPNTGSWNGSVSAGKALNAHLVMSVAYSYTQFPTSIVIAGPNLTQSAVMASLSWSPSERR